MAVGRGHIEDPGRPAEQYSRDMVGCWFRTIAAWLGATAVRNDTGQRERLPLGLRAVEEPSAGTARRREDQARDVAADIAEGVELITDALFPGTGRAANSSGHRGGPRRST
jgi:hypothetical protein